MAHKREIDIVDPGENIASFTVTIYGEDEAEVQEKFDRLYRSVSWFREAVDQDRTAEEDSEIDELEIPEIEEESEEGADG